MNDNSMNDSQDFCLYRDRTSLSIEEAVQFMIEGDEDLTLPRTYESIAGGTIFDRLKLCCEKAEANSAWRYPDEVRSTYDLNNAKNALNIANQYLISLQSAVADARDQQHHLLQWDEQSSRMRGCDMFLKASVIAWAYHMFNVNPFGLYSSSNDQNPDHSISTTLASQPIPHDALDGDQSSAMPATTTRSSSTETVSTGNEAHQHLAVTVYLVADALSRFLNTLENNTSDEEDSSTRYGNDEGIINCAEIAAYVVERIIHPQTELPSSPSSREAAPTDITELTLYLFAQTLAELLSEAISSDDLVIWQDQARHKMEQFIKGNRSYNSVAVQRYISKHILLNAPFPGQGERVMQGRLNDAKKQSTDQRLPCISEEEIGSCLQHAAQQFRLVEAKAKEDRPTQTQPTG